MQLRSSRILEQSWHECGRILDRRELFETVVDCCKSKMTEIILYGTTLLIFTITPIQTRRSILAHSLLPHATYKQPVDDSATAIFGFL